MEHQTGKLVVRVYATAAELPLEGATVVATTRDSYGTFELMSLLNPARSGLIDPLIIQTPNAEESTRQNNGGMAPFQYCEVWAEHPGFLVQRVAGVQLFPGVTTRQDMELIPLGEGEHALGRVDTRDVSAQNL